MPFNLGLHPAFKIPLDENEKFEDYKIIFNTPGTYEMPTVNLTDGTIDYENRCRTFTDLKELPLNYSDYDFDALVFENIKATEVTLTNNSLSHGIKFNFKEFPMLGVWTPNTCKAPFICIEPWHGCADPSDHDGIYEHKKDIIFLEPTDSKLFSYSFAFFK